MPVDTRRRADRWHREALIGVVLAVAGLPASQLPGTQAPSAQPPQTAAITGVVLDGTTKDPIAGAVVSLTRGREPIGQQARQLTDGKGRYAFTDLPAGQNYSLAASKFGYFDGSYGRETASNAPAALLSLTDGQWVNDARIVLWRPAAVGGTVTDENGDPVVNVYVRVLAQRRIAGQAHLIASASTMTDDRGRYRIAGLRPGRVYLAVPSIQWSVPATMSPAAIAGMSEQLAATREVPAETALDLADRTRLVLGSNFPTPPAPIDGRPQTYPIVFHPAATSAAEATVVELQYGEERDNVDIRLDPVAAVRVSGNVAGPPEAFAQLSLRLVPAGLEELGLGGEAATTVVSSDGSFTFLNVAAGAYIVDVVRGHSEYSERAGSTSPFDMMRPAAYPPRPPGVIGSGWSSNDMTSGPAGISYLSRSSLAAGRFLNGTTGSARVVVSARDILDLVVPLRAAATMHGHLVFEHDARQPATPRPQFVSLRAEPANGDPRLGLPRMEGPSNTTGDDFEIAGLQPGRYLIRANLSSTWILKSVFLNGKDVTDTPIDATGGEDFSGAVVTITNAAARVGGVVVDAQGQGASGAAIVIFPADPARWTDFGIWPMRIKTMSASNAGMFQFSPLPAGDYYVIALPADDIDMWQEPDFFKKAAARATRIAVGWGETKTVDLRVVEIR
jgi:hypothetical protein